MNTKLDEATGGGVAGIFDDADTLQAAIDMLQSPGFDRAGLSLFAEEITIQKELGLQYTKVPELEVDPDAPRTAYVPKESIGGAEGGMVGG